MAFLYTHTHTHQAQALTAYIQAEAVWQYKYISYVYRGHSFLSSFLSSLRLEAVILMWRAHHLRQTEGLYLEKGSLHNKESHKRQRLDVSAFAHKGKLDKPLCQRGSREGICLHQD